ncbi:MAG TPA: two-component regulator propeller domain-containing protein [Bacteroidales bacterium]|nr:two-component regulator propeller domain-containing protein [Bacteroidales bacterium]
MVIPDNTYFSNHSYSQVLRFLAVIILIGYNTFSLYSSSGNFSYLQPKDGLIEGEINSIVQDHEGIMWFATMSGLVSYDGYNFKHYKPELGNPNSLSEKKIKELFVDSENNLWIATSRGLSLFLSNAGTFRQYHFEENEQSENYTIQNVTEINKTLIVQTREKLYMLPLHEKDAPGYMLRRLKINGHGNQIPDSWDNSTAFQNTLYLISNSADENSAVIYTGLLKNDRYHSFLEVHKLVNTRSTINKLEYVKSESCLYIGTQKGIIKYSFKRGKLLNNIYFHGIPIQNLIYASDNRIYCTTNVPELLYIDLHTGKTGKYTANPYQSGTLLNNYIHTLYEDFSGNLWIGHQGQGISILNLHQKEFHTFRQDPFNKFSLGANKVMCFESTDKDVFIGLRTGGLNYTSKKLSPGELPVFKAVKLIENGKITSFNKGVWDIEKESNSLFWVGTDAGLCILEKEKGEWILRHYNNKHDLLKKPIRKILSDENHNLWCAVYEEGLLFIPDPAQNKTGLYYQYKSDINNPDALSDNTIISFYVDREGRFWVGTINGLNLLKTRYQNLDLSGKSPPTLNFKKYIAYKKDSNYLNNNEINCIYENFDGEIWMGTQGGGINILDPKTEDFDHFTTNNGLPGNNVLGILPDGIGKLWISTTSGLASINLPNNAENISHFSSSDGIQGDIFMANSYYKSTDGEMFFGGDNGFTRFYPQLIKPDTIKPKLIFTDLKFGNKVVNIGDTLKGQIILSTNIDKTKKIILPYKHKTFSIGVAAIHYQFPDENKITYKLIGYDKWWRIIPAKYRNIYYSNLPPGNYTLKVKSISSDDVLSDLSKVISIVVLKPWYLRWYAIIIFALVIISLTGGLIYIIVNHQKLIYEKKANQIAIENSENKMQFLTNIAHGLKTPLSLVIAPIADLIQNYEEIKPEWKNHLLLVQRNSNYLVQLINQIIDFRKLNAGKLILYKQKVDIVRIIRNVVLNFKSFEKSQYVTITTNIPYERLEIYADPRKMEEVLYNLLSNAFKHTGKGRNISISMEIDENFTDSSKNLLKITIFNEGKIIHEKDRKKIFERFYKVDEKIEGTGIGLSFSMSLVEMHGGRIDVEPVSDKGMAFHVLLPYTSVSDETTSSKPDSECDIFTENETYLDLSIENIEPVSEKKENSIILVEDNEELSRFMDQVLSRKYQCVVAKNGEEGIKLIKKQIPDIVISDIIMPEKDGYQLCKEIKADPGTCHIPVILLTAKSEPHHIISGYQTGADAYVTKPFDLEIISSQITRLIKNRELIKRKYLEQNYMIEVSSSNISKDDEFIMNFRNILEENISDPTYNVKSLARNLHVSSTQLYRKIKVLTGYSPVEFIRLIKLQKSYELLLKRNKSVKEVCYLSGFNNISYFIKCFRDQFGITPANLKEKGLIRHENDR